MLALWKNVSIAKKLYFVVGIMAFLIAGELLTLRFAMRNLSAARAFVGGESVWSKAQKDAVFSLQRYGRTLNEKDYQAFLEYLKIPEGDHQARMELSKKDFNFSVVEDGFLKGHIHRDDIPPIVELLRRFYWISYLSRAIEIWTQGDTLLFRLKDAGAEYHAAVKSRNTGRAEEILSQIKNLNEDLTVLEENFSSALGEGSRWLENMVLSILTMAVLTVETVGLTLAFLTSRAISKGLNELNETAHSIGQGHFTRKVNIHSSDEIGKLGKVVNSMGEMLQKSYAELEKRVVERTGELSKMASENARLYQETKVAVAVRDEFLSIASHELKTPLTSLYLQLQRLERYAVQEKTTKMADMAGTSVQLTKRLITLMEELLDLTRLRVGKFEVHREDCDLVPIVSEVVTQATADASRAGSIITFHRDGAVPGRFDPTRMGQVVTNLLSNAIKYGRGRPIEVWVKSENNGALLRVTDNGAGIPPEQQGRIFERFERGSADPNISGLGLGLYITSQIIKAHGGKITLESAPDKGSTFTVTV